MVMLKWVFEQGTDCRLKYISGWTGADYVSQHNELTTLVYSFNLTNQQQAWQNNIHFLSILYHQQKLQFWNKTRAAVIQPLHEIPYILHYHYCTSHQNSPWKRDSTYSIFLWQDIKVRPTEEKCFTESFNKTGEVSFDTVHHLHW